MLDANRINRWRIDDFCTKVAQLHCFDVAQLWNHISRAYDFGVSSHETIDIGPNLEDACIQSRSNNARSIVASASSKIGHFTALGISTDETTYNTSLRNFLPSLLNEFVAQFSNETVLSGLEFCLDELATIEPLCAINQSCNNLTANAFAVGNDSGLRLGTEVANEIDALIDAAKFVEQSVYCCQKLLALLASRDDAINHLFVSRLYLLERLLIGTIAFYSHLAGFDEFIGDATKGTNHNDDGLFLPLDDLLYTQYAFYGTNRSSAKLQYFHPCSLSFFACKGIKRLGIRD